MALSRRLTFVYLLLSLLVFGFCATSSSYATYTGAAALDNPPKVHLSLYYESLCPYSARFIVNYLAKIFTNGLISVVDLELVPYGNAKVKPDGNITCQHGPYECLLNTVEACAIEAWPDVTQHFDFIYCVEKLVVDGTYEGWESCFQKLGLSSQFVLDCSFGGHGKKLELLYAAQTDALEPPHEYVPWVVVNGKPLYEWKLWLPVAVSSEHIMTEMHELLMNNIYRHLLPSMDYETFETEICKAYQSDLPKVCDDLLLQMRPTINANQGHVSYKDMIATRSVLRSSSV